MFAAIMLSCLILSGCGEHGKANEQKTLTFATWGSQSEMKLVTPIIRDFEQQNNVKVEIIHIPQNYFQKLHLLFASNQAPDVLFINNYYLPVYAKAGVLADIEPFFKEEIANRIFFENSLSALSFSNIQYAIPRDVSNLVVYYNKDIFDKNGVKYPDKNWTYNDFSKTAKKLTNKEHWGVGFEENPLFWQSILWSSGGGIFDKDGNFILNKAESKSALDKYIALRTTEKSAPTRTQSANRTMAQMFLDGKIAMQISGRWLVPKYRQETAFKWDIAPMPRGNKGSISASDSSGWAISAACSDKELAAKFIKHLSSKNSITEMTKSGLITPARKDIAYSQVFLDGNNPKNAKVFTDINQNAINTPTTDHYNQKIERLTKILEPYFIGTKKINQDTTFEL